MAWVIKNEASGEYAGFQFPARTVKERPDAKEYATKAQALKALNQLLPRTGKMAWDSWVIEN